MRLADGSHLSYCTNVHPGESWDEIFAALRTHVPAVRRALIDGACEDGCDGTAGAPEGGMTDGTADGMADRAADGTATGGVGLAAAKAFGIGLRLSHASLTELEDADRLAAFRAWLDATGCYVFTLNGFPYGTFHGRPVKADVYRPDWTESARLDYTCRLATLATRLGAPGQRITISTLPGTYKAWARGAEAAIAANLLDCAAHCIGLHERTGVHVGIALEPEPCCLLETAQEACAFFADWLRTDAACARVARTARASTARAADGIRQHLGMCHDVCHSAVEFEPPLAAIERYERAGIRVMKLQLSAALRLAPADAAARAALAAFDEPVYLHQVVARERDGTLHRHPDIDAAMAAGLPLDSEWRVHFHVPVFLETLPGFGTTQRVLVELLQAHATSPLAPHLEVETYTWDVLPPAMRDVPVASAIARELAWVGARLQRASCVGERVATAALPSRARAA